MNPFSMRKMPVISSVCLGGLLAMSIATSIETLVRRFEFSLLNVSIYSPALIINVVIFILSYRGIIVGRTVSQVFEGNIQIVGGVVLISTGFKILLENTHFQTI